MTLEDIKERIDYIEKCAKQHDDEQAHGCEDALYGDFIRHIAQTDFSDTGEMARELLRTKKIDFNRFGCA